MQRGSMNATPVVLAVVQAGGQGSRLDVLTESSRSTPFPSRARTSSSVGEGQVVRAGARLEPGTTA